MKKVLLIAIIALSVSLIATSVAYDPQGLMFLNRSGASINVNVSLNKGTGSTYYGGESLGLSFSVDRSAYVAVLDIDQSGQVQVLFPNVYDQDNYVQGGRTYTLPTDKATTKYNLQVESNRGRETIVVVASTSPLNFLGNVFSLFDRYPFPYLGQNVNNLSIAIDPVFNTSWGIGKLTSITAMCLSRLGLQSVQTERMQMSMSMEYSWENHRSRQLWRPVCTRYTSTQTGTSYTDRQQ